MSQLQTEQGNMEMAALYFERAMTLAEAAKRCQRVKTIRQLRVEVNYHLELAQRHLAPTEPSRSKASAKGRGASSRS